MSCLACLDVKLKVVERLPLWHCSVSKGPTLGSSGMHTSFSRGANELLGSGLGKHDQEHGDHSELIPSKDSTT